jgi:hypothetical protein
MLKLFLVENEKSGQRGGKIEVKDQWRLSKNGRSLLVNQIVRSPDGSGTVYLIFSRKEVGPARSAITESRD